MDLDEGVVYIRALGCRDTRVTKFYMYKDGGLYCRSAPERHWHRSAFLVADIIPHLEIVPEHLRVSEGL